MIRSPYLYCALECAIACMLAELFTDAAAALLGHALGILQGITNLPQMDRATSLADIGAGRPGEGALMLSDAWSACNYQGRRQCKRY